MRNEADDRAVARPTPQLPTGVGSGGRELIFGLGWTVFSLFFVIVPLAILISERQTSKLLQSTGVTTEAVVISRRIDDDTEGSSYYVTYRYEVPVKGDRTTLTFEDGVDYDTFQELSPESRVLVRYSATNPSVVQLADRSRTFEFMMLACFMLFGGLFVLIGMWLIRSSWRGLYRARLLARHGALASGRVTDRWTETDSDGDNVYCIAFIFAEPGRPDVTCAEVNRKAYNTLQIGDSVKVRYVPGQAAICHLED